MVSSTGFRNRGNTVLRNGPKVFKSVQYETRRHTGRKHVGSIQKFIAQNKFNKYGGKTSDGVASQGGCTSGDSNAGYKGDLTPIINLMNESGWQPLTTNAGYVAGDMLAPGVFTTRDTVGSMGIQPVTGTSSDVKREKSSISDKNIVSILPPRQKGRCKRYFAGPKRKLSGTAHHERAQVTLSGKPKAMYKKYLLDCDKIGTGSEDYLKERGLDKIVIAPFTQHTMHEEKYAGGEHNNDGPNPFFPLAPLDPVEQQGYKPKRMDPADHYTLQPFNWAGNQVEASKDMADEKGKFKVQDLPNVSETNRATVHTAVQNYIWNGASHRSVHPPPRR